MTLEELRKKLDDTQQITHLVDLEVEFEIEVEGYTARPREVFDILISPEKNKVTIMLV